MPDDVPLHDWLREAGEPQENTLKTHICHTAYCSNGTNVENVSDEHEEDEGKGDNGVEYETEYNEYSGDATRSRSGSRSGGNGRKRREGWGNFSVVHPPSSSFDAKRNTRRSMQPASSASVSVSAARASDQYNANNANAHFLLTMEGSAAALISTTEEGEGDEVRGSGGAGWGVGGEDIVDLEDQIGVWGLGLYGVWESNSGGGSHFELQTGGVFVASPVLLF